MDERVESTVRRYYDALRAGEPLPPFFADDGPLVKVGVGERIVGAAAVAEALGEQTRTTDAWTVESRDLHVGTREGLAWFGDEVFMAWTDTERGSRFEFDTRWSGALAECEAGWEFVEMHVSTAEET